ncbi:MAG: TRAP transporter small permease [Tepidanaerobacteraceae bacterium]|nr:TRAP transporter small permease [Tepidanaerobacteraceae bacterium]
MEKISYYINCIINRISTIMMLLLTFITIIDITGRFVFNKPLPGTIEVTELSLVLIVYLTLGYTEHFDEHVVIDTAYKLMPKTVQFVLYMAAGLISFATVLLMAWQLYVYAGRMIAGDYQTGVLGIPYYPVVLAASFGSLCYSMAIVSNMIKFYKSERKENKS